MRGGGVVFVFTLQCTDLQWHDQSWDWTCQTSCCVNWQGTTTHNITVPLSTVMPLYDWVWQLGSTGATGASCEYAVVLLQRTSVNIRSKPENMGHDSWLMLVMWLLCHQGAFFTLTKCGHKLEVTIVFHLLQDSMPDLHSHFQYNDIQTHMYASQWFLTLFTAKFPLPMVYRIMDLFLCYVSHDIKEDVRYM